ncbi:MAG: hypothetical protein OXQ92_00230 [Boseongicola sp.]|nr:hypothetical protein [Boseongicola sp.]MDD9977689.1 hypothetical protein [Boseongicola sp.]
MEQIQTRQRSRLEEVGHAIDAKAGKAGPKFLSLIPIALGTFIGLSIVFYPTSLDSLFEFILKLGMMTAAFYLGAWLWKRHKLMTSEDDESTEPLS